MRACVVTCLLVFVASLCGCVDSHAKQQADARVPSAPALDKKKGNMLYLNAREPGPTDPDAPTEFTETSSGLRYRLLRKTDGNKPVAADTVLCNYRGTLDNGKEFDSSYARGSSIDFPLLGVIKGWTEGLQYCPEGGMIELEIPSELGYGARGAGRDIPPNSRLHFIVELVKIL